jgi:radical SAM superfamily enzyme YgiQ (UPF0313 family)
MVTVALVYPPYQFKPLSCCPPPLVLAHLHAVLESAKIGHVESIDLDLEFSQQTGNVNSFLERAIRRVESVNPDVVCLSCKSAQFPFSVLFSREYKSRHSDVKVVMGGWMPTLIPEKTLYLSGCDAVIRGEGERSLPQLLRRIDDREWKIDGISYAMLGEKRSIVNNPNSKTLIREELDKLPFPNYEALPPISRYQPGYDRYYFVVEASRGCVNHQCLFCWNSTKNCDTSWRTKSPKRVVQDVRFLVDTYGADRVLFADDCFGSEIGWLSEFASLMRSEFRRGEIRYGASMRVDTINDDLIKSLRESGLQVLFHGIESGSPRCWRTLGKNFDPKVTPQYIVGLVRKEVEVGITAACSFMVGIPKETEEDLDETIDLCRRLKDVGAVFSYHILTPYEGTSIYEDYGRLIEPHDIYGDFGESESLYAELRAIFGGRLEEFSGYLPDDRWVRPSVPVEVFREKYDLFKKTISKPSPRPHIAKKFSKLFSTLKRA